MLLLLDSLRQVLEPEKSTAPSRLITVGELGTAGSPVSCNTLLMHHRKQTACSCAPRNGSSKLHPLVTQNVNSLGSRVIVNRFS